MILSQVKQDYSMGKFVYPPKNYHFLTMIKSLLTETFLATLDVPKV